MTLILPVHNAQMNLASDVARILGVANEAGIGVVPQDVKDAFDRAFVGKAVRGIPRPRIVVDGRSPR